MEPSTTTKSLLPFVFTPVTLHTRAPAAATCTQDPDDLLVAPEFLLHDKPPDAGSQHNGDQSAQLAAALLNQSSSSSHAVLAGLPTRIGQH